MRAYAESQVEVGELRGQLQSLEGVPRGPSNDEIEALYKNSGDSMKAKILNLGLVAR